ncbi:MAG: SpoIID/LytB domain-containing protein [Flavobacteriales bacterium]|nr:SpoIID/LytB domain-containing protein [Flavobacteriales bacterium]
MLRRTLSIALLLPTCLACAQFQEVQVAVLHAEHIVSATLIGTRGPMTIMADGHIVGELAANDGLRIELKGGQLHARTLSGTYAAREKLTLMPRSKEGGVRLRPSSPKLPERSYPGTIEVRKDGGHLLFVNEARLEDYVAGVVQSEAGRDKPEEYYKLQAVSCRTYALANARKHEEEGFELCDEVHCQVYHGRADVPLILSAVQGTRGMVVVDANIQLIHATFHSNCGGETVNAEDVWSRPEPYLQGTVDTFCLAQPHATWRRALGKEQWLNYLANTYGLSLKDKDVVRHVLDQEPPCRELYLNGHRPLIPLKQVRDDWKLNSTYFAIHTEGDSVIFSGRGFGHGVGLCQEGAMEMARDGYAFTEILHHYYQDVHLIDLSNLEFFREDGP